MYKCNMVNEKICFYVKIKFENLWLITPHKLLIDHTTNPVNNHTTNS